MIEAKEGRNFSRIGVQPWCHFFLLKGKIQNKFETLFSKWLIFYYMNLEKETLEDDVPIFTCRDLFDSVLEPNLRQHLFRGSRYTFLLYQGERTCWIFLSKIIHQPLNDHRLQITFDQPTVKKISSTHSPTSACQYECDLGNQTFC